MTNTELQFPIQISIKTEFLVKTGFSLILMQNIQLQENVVFKAFLIT